jgi:hypothetical protein
MEGQQWRKQEALKADKRLGSKWQNGSSLLARAGYLVNDHEKLGTADTTGGLSDLDAELLFPGFHRHIHNSYW